MIQGKEAERLKAAYSGAGDTRWLFWGPYLSERQWGTVREDYSAYGDAWDYFPHEHARSRAYRWGEDGLAGISDDKSRLCCALALWNGNDPIVKERLFGLTNSEGNHGEDVKEYYFYLDNTPTHSYMKWLYKYPQRAFPYSDLVHENARRKQDDPGAFEYELIDTGVFADDRYFDVQVEYAKAGPMDILIRITVTNRGPDAADLHLLPTLWYRNTWSADGVEARPALRGARAAAAGGVATLLADAISVPSDSPDGATEIPAMTLYCLGPDDLLFCDNESNAARLWGAQVGPRYPKDGINDHVVEGKDTVNPALTGTKGAALYRLHIGAGQTVEARLRLSSDPKLAAPFGADFDATFTTRVAEADEFYASVGPAGLTDDQRSIQRQAYAGMLWGKQFYYYVISEWIDGDKAQPPPPATRTRNKDWIHFYASNILSMPDKWEYPWFASWDLCFQSVVLARVDARFAKDQLLVLAREWYTSPAGAVPAYEWAFGDVNPPLHAWAALRIFEIEQEMTGGPGDVQFLADIFQHCLVYFTWWINRKDADDNNLFQGGFLGLDNISIIDRSHLDALEETICRRIEMYQSDGTSWMAMFSLDMLRIALRLAETAEEYGSLASKFFQHFVFIADAINAIEHRSAGSAAQVTLWDENDNFYYDALKISGVGVPDEYLSVKLRSLVGIIALFPVFLLDPSEIERRAMGQIAGRIQWFTLQHKELLEGTMSAEDQGGRRLLSLVKPERLRAILERVLDEGEFLGPHGVRGISGAHRDPPYSLDVSGETLSVRYEPAESVENVYGGNSNWRGPVWFPINFMLIQALRRYHEYLGDGFKVAYPSGSGEQHTLAEVATDLSRRLVRIFERGADGKRPVYGGTRAFQEDPHWRDLMLFYEYFHGDNGAGLGASHQTGWTGLCAELLRAV
ncbi:glucosidase [Sorangium sp. So ce726]|uniref:MGH1-like glycoside hydrolase domain-containing protein n=1 Tax=Sorangium sp. So ce726 TaxID=3133319 RepID=UPI003F5E5CEF